MPPNETGINIINRGNGLLTGESANALPVTIKTSLSSLKLFFLGVGVSIIVFFFMVIGAKTQVQTVEIVAQAPDFKIVDLK